MLQNQVDSKFKILFLIQRRDFEYSNNSEPDIPKQNGLLAALRGDPRFEVKVEFHVESIRIVPRSKYGWHISVRLALMRFSAINVFKILTSLLSTYSSKFDHPGRHRTESKLRTMWSDLGDSFWHEYLSRNRYNAILGTMLSAPEIRQARKLGIPTFEIQHGIMETGTLRQYFPEVAPDFICTWPINSAHVSFPEGTRQLGIPFTWIQPNSTPQKQDRRYLVILGQGIELSPDPVGLMDPVLWESIRRVSWLKHCLIFRFHPKTSEFEIEAFKRWLGTSLGELSFQSHLNLDIHEAVINSNAVLMGSSTVWLDAIFAGVPAIICSGATYERAVTDFPEMDGALLFKSPGDFKALFQGDKPRVSTSRPVKVKDFQSFLDFLSTY